MTRIRLADPPRPWMPRKRLKRFLGRLTFPKAADRHPIGVYLNRYPHEVIGLWVSFGGQRYLSWVWPIRITGLKLTAEQWERQTKEYLGDDA